MDFGAAGILYTAGANFGLLAPTIAYVLINEADDEAVLYGVFGNPPANSRSVLIGIEATVNSWTNGEIHCELPRTGTGSAGNVEVWVRGHKSNVRRITEWNVPIQYTWKNTSLSGPTVAGPITLRFRADVGDYRDFPGIPPLKPERWALATRDSIASLTGSGTGVDGGCTHTWSGQRDFPASGFPGGPIESLIAARFKVDTVTNTGAIGLALGAATSPYTMTIVCPPEGSTSEDFMVALGLLDGVQGFHSPNPDPNDPEVPLPAVNITFGPDYTIPARDFVDNNASPLQIQLSWSDVVPFAPPDPGAARSVPDRRGG